MRYCPNCGEKLSEGVTRCWNRECGLILHGPNKFDDMTMQRPKSEKLLELEMEYELAKRGLAEGIRATFAAMLSAGFTFLALIIVTVMGITPLLTGHQLVIIFGILAVAVILYFALVFGRAAKIKAQISKEKKEVQVELGKRVR